VIESEVPSGTALHNTIVSGTKVLACSFCDLEITGRRHMATFEQTLGQVIAEQRRKAELSQEALAHLCDLHATYISQLERGVKSPTVRVLRAIGVAMGVPASKILAKAETVSTD